MITPDALTPTHAVTAVSDRAVRPAVTDALDVSVDTAGHDEIEVRDAHDLRCAIWVSNDPCDCTDENPRRNPVLHRAATAQHLDRTHPLPNRCDDDTQEAS